MSMFLELIEKYSQGLLIGLGVTAKLCLIVWSAGLICGLAGGALAARLPRSLGRLLQLTALLISAIPVLVLLFWFHYPAQALLHIVVDPFVTASVVLSVVNAVLVAEIVRDGIRRLPSDFIRAAQVCGMSRLRISREIEIPLILRQIVPGLLSTQITMLQATLFASLISVDEIFRVIQRINAVEYRPVELFSALAFFFVAVCLPLTVLAKRLEQRHRRDLE